MAREEDARFPAGISPGDDDDFLSGTELCFEGRRPIPDAPPLECREVLDRRTSIARAGRDDDGAGAEVAAVFKEQGEQAVLPRAIELLYFDGERELDPQLPCHCVLTCG